MLQKMFTSLKQRMDYATKAALQDMSLRGPGGLTPGKVWTGGWGRVSGSPVRDDWSLTRTTEEGMARNHQVFRCLRFLAETWSSVPLIGQVRKKENEWITKEDLPLHKLVNRPNFRMTRQFMIENIAMNLAGAGNSLWWKIRASSVAGRQKPVVNLWPLRTDKVRPVPDDSGWLKNYEVINAQGETISLPVNDVTHIMLQNPDNVYWGMGPLQASAQLIDTDTDALTFWKKSLSRRCIKDGILTLAEPLPTETWEEYRDLVEQQLTGPNNAHGILLIGEEAKYTPIMQTALELDFVNSRKLTREEIPAAMGIPPILVGVLENSSYANFDRAMAHYWENTAVPGLEIIRSALNMMLTPEFGDPQEMRLWFDLAAIPALRYDLGDRTKILRDVWMSGCPFYIAAQWLNLGIPRFKGDDISYIQSGILPADELTGDGEESRLSEARRAAADNAALPKRTNGKKTSFEHPLLADLSRFSK